MFYIWLGKISVQQNTILVTENSMCMLTPWKGIQDTLGEENKLVTEQHMRFYIFCVLVLLLIKTLFDIEIFVLIMKNFKFKYLSISDFPNNYTLLSRAMHLIEKKIYIIYYEV